MAYVRTAVIVLRTYRACRGSNLSTAIMHSTYSGASSGISSLLGAVPYSPPLWLTNVLIPVLPGNNINTGNHIPIPQRRLQLGRFPTPIHPFNIQEVLMTSSTGSDDGQTPIPSLKFFIKRDDLSSFDLSGNKVRKLEFLVCEAKDKGHDSVVTIGGIQSNHARSTAVASRQIGLDPYLILRTSSPETDPGLVVCALATIHYIRRHSYCFDFSHYCRVIYY